MSLYDRIRTSRTLPLVESIQRAKHREALNRALYEADEAEPEITRFGHLANKSFPVHPERGDPLAPRGAGSQTGANMRHLIPHDTPVHEFRPHKDADFAGARYFKLHQKDVHPDVWNKLNPKLGAKAYAELSPEEKSRVKVRPGHAWGKASNGDGRELYVDRPAHDKHMSDTDHITFITSRQGQGWTHHPGSPLAVHDSKNKRGTAAHWKEQGHDPDKVNTNRAQHASPEDHEGPNPGDATAVKLHSGT